MYPVHITSISTFAEKTSFDKPAGEKKVSSVSLYKFIQEPITIT